MQKPAGELEFELKDITKRDVQLWSIALMLVVVLAIGFVALVAPNLVWKGGPVDMNSRYLPHLFTAFIVLIVLANIYLAQQRRRLNAMREVLLRRLIAESDSDDISVFDPLTKVFNHRHMERVLLAEIARANRANTAMTLVIVDLVGFKALNAKFGSVAGDHALVVLARILRNSLRGSDTICRVGGDEFLIIMPDTTELQAKAPIARLNRLLAEWNANTGVDYKLTVRHGTGQYNAGADICTALSCASYAAGANISPVIAQVKRLACEYSLRDKTTTQNSLPQVSHEMSTNKSNGDAVNTRAVLRT
ncbi:MAG: GGDEF domain-containing protein [Terriglobales bacterium]